MDEIHFIDLGFGDLNPESNQLTLKDGSQIDLSKMEVQVLLGLAGSYTPVTVAELYTMLTTFRQYSTAKIKTPNSQDQTRNALNTLKSKLPQDLIRHIRPKGGYTLNNLP